MISYINSCSQRLTSSSQASPVPRMAGTFVCNVVGNHIKRLFGGASKMGAFTGKSSGVILIQLYLVFFLCFGVSLQFQEVQLEQPKRTDDDGAECLL